MRRLLLAISLIATAAFAQGNRSPHPLAPFEATLPDGSKMDLTKYKGKVCVIEFLFTTCPHCAQTAAALTQLNRELGSQGFQPLGVAFNDGAMMLVPEFIRSTGANYPIGVANREKVIAYLGHSVTARLLVPQVMIVDKKGMVRYQSSLDASEHLHDPVKLKQIITDLLKEPAGPASAKKSVSMNKK